MTGCETWCPCGCGLAGCACHPGSRAELAASGAAEGTVPCETCQGPAQVQVIRTAKGATVTARFCPRCDLK